MIEKDDNQKGLINPIVSIIIPCYNQGKYILEAIQSVEQCDSAMYEVIIVNDGSTDAETTGIIHELTRKGYHVINQPNLGLAAARNNGITKAKGEYILPLDADNRIRPNYLPLGVSILQSYPEIGVVYGDPFYFGTVEGRVFVEDFEIAILLVRNYVDACAIYRRRVWADCGGYDPNMPVMGHEDWDFWLSAYSCGWKFAKISEVTYDYRVREDSMMSLIKRDRSYVQNEEYIAKKHLALYKTVITQLVEQERCIQDFKRRPLKTLIRFITKAWIPELYESYSKWYGLKKGYGSVRR